MAMLDPRKVLRAHGSGNLLLREWENTRHSGTWLTLGDEEHPLHVRHGQTYEECVSLLNMGCSHKIRLYDDHLKAG